MERHRELHVAERTTTTQIVRDAAASEHKTEIAVREGRLRASPHFYNTEEQIDRLIAALPGH